MGDKVMTAMMVVITVLMFLICCWLTIECFVFPLRDFGLSLLGMFPAMGAVMLGVEIYELAVEFAEHIRARAPKEG